VADDGIPVEEEAPADREAALRFFSSVIIIELNCMKPKASP